MTALATVLTVGLGLGLAPSSSVAVESHPPSPAGEFVIEGRGYGHGRGLSQWGAQGAATQGLSSSQILAFYYPGTSLTGQPNSDIRVRLSTGRPQEVAVDGQAGLRLHWQGGVLTLPVSSASGSILSWRLLTGPGGLVLDYVDSGAAVWRRYSVVPGTEASFFATSGTVRLVQPNFERREYRGGVGAIIAPSGALSTYNTVLMEDYLRSVVPSEMPASWHPQALAAQATAARTYASFERHSSTAGTDTCDTTACQVYSGARLLTSGGAVVRSYESAATNQAIVATSGSVVITGGPFSYAFTQFSSSNGGWTSAGTLPYQVAKPDPYDGALPSTAHAWTARVSATAVRNAFPTAGQPLRLSVLARTGGGEWGGRVTRVAVVGTAGTVTVSGDAFRSALGLRSAWWTTSGAAQASGSIATDVDGDGTSDLFGRQLATGALMFYAGRPDGTYTSPRTVGTGWEMHDWIVAAGDVTGDGVPDLYAREAATGTLWLYPLRRDGSATGRVAVGTGWQTLDLIVAPGDVTGDGVPDLYGRDAVSGNLVLYTGQLGGGFTSREVVNAGWHGLDSLVGVGDRTGDGVPDLVGRDRASGALLLYTVNPGGSIAYATRINSGWNSFDALVGSTDSRGAQLLARAPGQGGGTLVAYPLQGTAVLPGRTIGVGWDMHVALF
ncbi:SpoIID/LytB domain-containing protein [Oerskovia enterophila]